MIRMFRCTMAIVWFGISMGCVDALDVCEGTKGSCIGASGESGGVVICSVPEVAK